jgi:hypothetical protein
MDHNYCENAYRIGFFKGDQSAINSVPEDLLGLDSQERWLTEILEQSLYLAAALRSAARQRRLQPVLARTPFVYS